MISLSIKLALKSVFVLHYKTAAAADAGLPRLQGPARVGGMNTLRRFLLGGPVVKGVKTKNRPAGHPVYPPRFARSARPGPTFRNPGPVPELANALARYGDGIVINK